MRNALVVEHADASGGKAVVNIYQERDSLTFKNIPSAKAISIRYAKGSEGDLSTNIDCINFYDYGLSD